MVRKEKKIVIERGNVAFWMVMIFFGIITIVGCIQFKRMDIETCRICLLVLNIISLIIMIPYRIYLLFDKEYMDLVYKGVKKPYWYELPFFPCNTAEILYSVALFTQSRVLISYCFCMGFIGPVIALIIPSTGFEKEPLFKIRVLGFYTTHYICLMNLPLLIVSRFFIPNYMDVLTSLGVYTLFSIIFYFLNIFIDSMNLGMPANYFFNKDPNSNPIFKKCYEFIPHEFLFSLPVTALCGIILAILVFIIHLFV